MSNDRNLMERLVKVTENNGWSVSLEENSDEKCAEFEKWSPAGEDFVFSVAYEDAGDLVKAVAEFEEGFDAEEHVVEMLDAKRSGLSGVPDVKTLVEDADAIRDMLCDLSYALEDTLESIKSENGGFGCEAN